MAKALFTITMSIEFLQNQQLLLIFVSGIFTAIAASLLGAFIVVKRMALVGDVLSHVALPGIGLALLINIDPIYGAAAFLLIAAFGTWFIEKKNRVAAGCDYWNFFYRDSCSWRSFSAQSRTF